MFSSAEKESSFIQIETKKCLRPSRKNYLQVKLQNVLEQK